MGVGDHFGNLLCHRDHASVHEPVWQKRGLQENAHSVLWMDYMVQEHVVDTKSVTNEHKS
jgi:hypothetical protein